MPGVEAVRGGLAADDGYVRREQRIEAATRGSVAFVAGDLAPCMNARVGAAGDGQWHGVAAQHDAESALQLSLNGSLLRLDSPAGERGTVVLDVQTGRH